MRASSASTGWNCELRSSAERNIEKLGLARQSPRDEADAKRRRCLLFELAGLLLEPDFFAVAPAENAEPAGVTHSERQASTGNHIHRRQQNRMPDTQQGVQWRVDRHRLPSELDREYTSG